jgi:hypothetical protein
MNSPLESLAAFAIAFILGIVSAAGLGIYARALARRIIKCQERSFQTA